MKGWQSEMGIGFFVYCMIWNALHLQYRFCFDMIMVMSWFCIFYELYFLWFILYMVNYIPLHDSYDKIHLYFKPLVTKSRSFHKFMLVVPLLLNFVFHFYVIQIFNNYMIFLYLCYIPIHSRFWFYWIIF